MCLNKNINLDVRSDNDINYIRKGEFVVDCWVTTADISIVIISGLHQLLLCCKKLQSSLERGFMVEPGYCCIVCSSYLLQHVVGWKHLEWQFHLCWYFSRRCWRSDGGIQWGTVDPQSEMPNKQMRWEERPLHHMARCIRLVDVASRAPVDVASCAPGVVPSDIEREKVRTWKPTAARYQRTWRTVSCIHVGQESLWTGRVAREIGCKTAQDSSAASPHSREQCETHHPLHGGCPSHCTWQWRAHLHVKNMITVMFKHKTALYVLCLFTVYCWHNQVKTEKLIYYLAKQSLILR